MKTSYPLSRHAAYATSLLFSAITLLLCTHSSIAADTNQISWTVVGAGPTGIMAVGMIMESGVPAEQIVWLDPEFNVGRMGKYYQNVPGNGTVNQYITYLRTCATFNQVESPALERLHNMPLHHTPPLHAIVEPLLDITHYVRNQITTIQDEMIALEYHDNQWHIQTHSNTFSSDNVVLATGAHPKTLRYEGVPHIPLDIALDKAKLAECVEPHDTVAVIGSAHSALLIVKHLSELPVNSIINFYKKPIVYPTHTRAGIIWQEAGLKGELATWTKTVLATNPPHNLLRVPNSAENLESLLPQCTKIIYAAGFEQNELPAINGDSSIYQNYDRETGMIAPHLFGLGIAFPQEKVDPEGNTEQLVGLAYLRFDSLREALSTKSTSAARKPHIALKDGVPGIRSLFMYRPETSIPLNQLVEELLVNSSTLTRGEREIIASYTSYLNECTYCCSIHSAIATALFNGDAKILQAVKDDYTTAPITEKLKALLAIAAKVQKNARSVTEEDVNKARTFGATDLEIHDTVLIAAAFCMYNRYVDGLATWTPEDPKFYEDRGQIIAQNGYNKINQEQNLAQK